MVEDTELLRRYAEGRSQAAFEELVRRHLNLVYSVALRQVGGDSHLAEDVTQQVFVALARKAAQLTTRATVSGWLYRCAHFAASDTVRVERRRRSREQEAHTMEGIEEGVDFPKTATGEAIDWDRVRPTLDAAIAELDDDDRDAVSLRFFEGRSFGEIGARARLSENASRMRVERALDKLYAALARRGVTSTSSALALALANQVAVAAPPSLAASVAASALAASVGGTAALVGFMSTGKVIGISTAMVAAAVSVAVVQYDGKRAATAALAATEVQRHALETKLASSNARLAQAERRAADAEKDSGELLKAVQAARTQAAARATESSGAPPVGPANRGDIVGAVGPIAQNRTPEEDERLAAERAYQQQLAKRRAQEAMARAKIQSEAAADPDPVARFQKLMQAAERYAAEGDFRAGIQTYNMAMEMKPADVAVTDEMKHLQARLQAQNAPVEISLLSDGITNVSVTGPYGMRAPSPLQTAQVKVMPGTYEVIGRRKGYEDVVVRVEVRNGVPPPVVSIACSIPETKAAK